MLDTPKLPAGTFSSQYFQQQETAGLCYLATKLLQLYLPCTPSLTPWLILPAQHQASYDADCDQENALTHTHTQFSSQLFNSTPPAISTG